MCVTRFILLPFGVIVQMSPRKSLLPTGTMHVKAMHFPLGDQVGAKDWTAPSSRLRTGGCGGRGYERLTRCKLPLPATPRRFDGKRRY